MREVLDRVVVPSEATEASWAALSQALEGRDPVIVIGAGGPVELTADVRTTLATAARALASGHSAVIAEPQRVLTTQEAADYLGVSRPTLVRILEAGKIPFAKPGTHRRIRLEDLILYVNTIHLQRRAILDEMLEASANDPDLRGVDGIVATR
jgi:excisionase family DNA binding protein